MASIPSHPWATRLAMHNSLTWRDDMKAPVAGARFIAIPVR
jgi:hypothetical protein